MILAYYSYTVQSYHLTIVKLLPWEVEHLEKTKVAGNLLLGWNIARTVDWDMWVTIFRCFQCPVRLMRWKWWLVPFGSLESSNVRNFNNHRFSHPFWELQFWDQDQLNDWLRLPDTQLRRVTWGTRPHDCKRPWANFVFSHRSHVWPGAFFVSQRFYPQSTAELGIEIDLTNQLGDVCGSTTAISGFDWTKHLPTPGHFEAASRAWSESTAYSSTSKDSKPDCAGPWTKFCVVAWQKKWRNMGFLTTVDC